MENNVNKTIRVHLFRRCLLARVQEAAANTTRSPWTLGSALVSVCVVVPMYVCVCASVSVRLCMTQIVKFTWKTKRQLGPLACEMVAVTATVELEKHLAISNDD